MRTRLIVLVALASAAALSAQTVNITSIEINQGIGLQKNGARKFVAGKDTVVRAFLASPAAIDAAQTSATISRNGEAIATLAPNSYDDATPVVDFVCPSRDACGNWTAGSYSFEVSVNGVKKSTEGAYNFVERGKIRVLALPVKANFGGKVVRVTDSRWKTFADFVRGTYPVAADSLIWVTREELDASGEEFDLETEDGRRNLWEALAKLIPSRCAADPTEDGCYTQVFGFIMDRPMGYPNGRLQGYTYGMPANIGVVKDEDAAATVAHEIGHTYGLGDTYDGGSFACKVNPAPDSFDGKDFDDASNPAKCSTGREALEGVSGTLVPADHHPYEIGGRGALPAMAEYMGSGGKQEQFWTTQDAWDHLFDKLAPETGGSSVSQAPPGPARRYIQCFGAIRKNATTAADVRMDPCWEFEDTDVLASTTGPYMMTAVDATGRVLGSDAFRPTFDPVGPKGMPSQSVEFAPFTAEFLFPAETVKLQVIRDGVIVREIPISRNVPAVSNVAPQLAGVATGSVTITWDASDADGDTLSYLVLYNADIGDEEAEWEILMADLTEKRFTIDFDDMPGGPQARVAILATDGINVGEGISGPFIVATKPPEVFIEDFPNGGVVVLGREVIFDGDAFDLQDSDIPESRLEWNSNISGPLGRGTPLRVGNLPAGLHTITLTATNSDGLRGSASAQLLVTANPRRRNVKR